MVIDRNGQRSASEPREQGFEGETTYLRCGGCGAAIALKQRPRHDGQLAEYILDSHESCAAPVALRGGWGIGA